MPPEQRYFEDFEVGETFQNPSQTVTEAHFQGFAGLSGDFHPIHLDEEYATEGAGMDGRVAHGFLLTLFTALGASPLAPHTRESLVAFLGQSSRFLRPVYVGDTVHPELRVAETEARGDRGVVTFTTRVTNGEGETVLEGELEFLFRTRDDSG